MINAELLLLHGEVNREANPSGELLIEHSRITFLVKLDEDALAVERYLGVPCFLFEHF